MADNNENTLGSGFITDSGQTGGADLGSGFVTSAEPSSNAPQTGANALASTFTDIKELSVQGAMSTVYKGKKYGKWHIIKRIKTPFKDNPQYRELFMKEFDNGVQLDHPNIVRFEDKGEDAEGLWYTMEYVDGRPLSDLIKTGELIKNERLTRSIITQLCDALTYVHKKQIVHRDLKPDNILVTYRGDNVKVLDFGLAYSDSYDDHLVKAGTPKYAAPEQMTKGNLVDQRADIYAVGLILLEMCTGSLVDKTASTVQNPNFKLVINRATQADPDQRYHDCREILEDLNSTVVTGTSLQQTHAAEVKPAARPAETPVEGERKKNMLPIFIIIGLLLIGGIVAWLLLSNKDKDKPTADNNEPKQEQPQKHDNNGGKTTTPDTPKDNSKTDNTQQQDNSSNSGITDAEREQNAQDSKLKEEFEAANTVFNDKNVAKAKKMYEELLKKTDLPKAIKDEANKNLAFCNKTISQSKLYPQRQVKGENGLFGLENSDHYIIVDFLYKNFDHHHKITNLLAVQNANGMWGLIDEASKLPVTEFIYPNTQRRQKLADAYRMFLDEKQKDWDDVKIDATGKLTITKTRKNKQQ